MRGEVAHQDLAPASHVRPHGGWEGLLGEMSELQHVQEAGGLLAGLGVRGGGLEEGEVQEADGVAGVRDPGEDPREGGVGQVRGCLRGGGVAVAQHPVEQGVRVQIVSQEGLHGPTGDLLYLRNRIT